MTSRNVDIYLQGSYANATNIRGDSDVDLVTELQSVWQRDLGRLTDWERQAYERDHVDSDYG